jgi:hypothetical protein
MERRNVRIDVLLGGSPGSGRRDDLCFQFRFVSVNGLQHCLGAYFRRIVLDMEQVQRALVLIYLLLNRLDTRKP